MRQGFSERKGPNFVNVWASISSGELSSAKDPSKDTVVERRRLKRSVVGGRTRRVGRGCGKFAVLRYRC